MKVKKIQKGKKYDMIKNNLHFLKRKIALTLATIMTFSFVADVKQVGVPKINAVETKVTYGDVNSDGTINLLDMILLKSYLTENNTKGFCVETADLDDDGKVSAKDAVELSMYLMNQIGSFSYEMNIDTDGDGLSDYVEKEILGTKYDIPDSDGDDLDDYSEVYLCGTDPTKPDTGDTGIKDSLKDADEDGLTNGEEIKIGTSPTLSDTDEDQLSDFDEVKKYKTNPNKLYSDDDLISDFGEVKLGLNPLVEKSDGIQSDSDRIFDQQLTSDNIIFKEINSEDSPYKLSLITKSSGYIDESVSVSISSYSNYLQNNAVEGEIIDIDYSDDFTVKNIKINFNVPENADNYYIFRYFDDVNMLLPVDTQYDGNNVYTETTEDGTYCIVDMDKWIENTAALSAGENVSTVYNAVYASSDTKSSADFEVYFLMYISGSSVSSAREAVTKSSRILIDYCNKNNKKIKLFYASYRGDVIVNSNTNLNYLDNGATDIEIEDVVNHSIFATINVSQEVKSSSTLHKVLSKSLADISSESQNCKKYCFVVDINFQPPCATNMAVVEKMKQNGVDFSFICMDTNDNVDIYDSLSSDSSHYKWIPDFSEIVTDKVLNYTIVYNVNTGLFNIIPYDQKLITLEWKDIFDRYYSKNLSEDDRLKLLDEIKKLGLPDTDGDETPDCLEIYMKFITFDENGNIILPTYDQLAKDVLENSGFGVNGLYALSDILKRKGVSLENLHVIPLISNPLIGDSDGDGINDNVDEFTASTNPVEIDYNLLNDSYIFLDDNEKEELISSNCLDPNIDIYNIDYKFNNKKLPSCGELKGSPVYEGDKFVTNKPEVEYTRYYDRKSYYEYRIFNYQNSDYDITINSDEIENFDIGVYEIKWGKQGAEVTSTETQTDNQKEYKFALNEGKSYKICIKTDKPLSALMQKFTFSIKQNNWIYSPDGGVVTGRFNYSAIYLTDNAIKMICDLDGKGLMRAEEWDRNKSADDFERHLTDNLVAAFYDNDANYLGLIRDQNHIFSVSSTVSTASTYAGLIAYIFKMPAVGEVATVTGAVTTYVASYPVSSEEFRKTVRVTLESISGNDKSISLHKNTGLFESFSCFEWKYKFINKYSEYYNSWVSYDKTDLHNFAYQK